MQLVSLKEQVPEKQNLDKAPTMERTEAAEDGYVGPIYDVQEDKKQKVKGSYTKESGKGERNKVRKGFHTRHL